MEQSETIQSPVDIGSGIVPSADSAGVVTGQLINWRVDASGANTPRPAIASYTSTGLSASPVIGAYVFQSQLIVVTDDRYIWRVPASGPTIAVALSTSTTTTQLDGEARPVFAEDASDVFIAGGGSVQKWTPGAATASRLGGTSPTPVTHIAALGQRLIANDTSDASTKDNIYWSDSGDANDSTWNALSVANVEARPDDVKAIYENTNELFVWGDSTLQVYGVGADPAAPFEPANTLNIGIAAIYSPVKLDSAFAFLDDRYRFVISDGRSVEPFGEAVESDVRAMTDATDLWGFRRTSDRYDELVWQFPTARRTLVYDLRSKRWGDDKYYDGGTQQPMPFGAYSYWPALRYHIYGSNKAAGGLYQLSTTARSDLGGPLLCERMTGWQNHGTDVRKRSKRVRAVIRRGTVAHGSTAGSIEMRVQDDGGAWTDWKQASVGNLGDGYQTRDFFFGGIFRRRRYGIRYSGSDDTAVISVTEHHEACAS